MIEAKSDGIRDAFAGFDPERVAALTDADVDRLLEDPRIIRNRKKVEATVVNAQRLLELDREHGGFERYLGSLGSHSMRRSPRCAASSGSSARWAPTSSSGRSSSRYRHTRSGPGRTAASRPDGSSRAAAAGAPTGCRRFGSIRVVQRLRELGAVGRRVVPDSVPAM